MNLPQPKCSTGATQSEPYLTRAGKVMASAGPNAKEPRRTANAGEQAQSAGDAQSPASDSGSLKAGDAQQSGTICPACDGRGYVYVATLNSGGFEPCQRCQPPAAPMPSWWQPIGGSKLHPSRRDADGGLSAVGDSSQ